LRTKIHNSTEAFIALREGREEGLDFFFSEYYVQLLWFGRKLLKQETIAEDVVADCFVKLWKLRTKLLNEATVKSLLYTSVRNASIDLLRRKKRDSAYRAEMIYLDEIDDSNVLKHLVESEMHQLLYKSTQSLPVKCARVFKMFYFEGKSYQEIADELEVSIHTVRNQKARAMELFKEKIPKHFLSILLIASLLCLG
jgi:RNA polymerase sigma-70 factor (family 1)